MDPLPLAQALIRCRSVTPADDGAQAVLAAALAPLGFTVTRLNFGGIDNLFAERGKSVPHLCFAGHTDVVPPGDATWRHDPFAGEIMGDALFGRGAVDMKGAIAAFVAAAGRSSAGKLSLLITGDEEGEAINGTQKLLEWLAAQGRLPDFCVVGEPTSQTRLGDTIKIGRRGSLSATITVAGQQGHVAYPQRADNPVHRLIPALAALMSQRLDEGTAFFEPSSLQITSVDVGNQAANVIPARAAARLNIRFNDLQSETALTDWLTETLAFHAPAASLDIRCTGEAFLTRPGPHTAMLTEAVVEVTGLRPAQNTGGGTSDARFIVKYCPVAEFGLVGTTMHQADEAVKVAELRQLADVYHALIRRFCP